MMPMPANAAAAAEPAAKRRRDTGFIVRDPLSKESPSDFPLRRAKPRVRALVAQHSRQLPAEATELLVVPGERCRDPGALRFLLELAAFHGAPDPRGKVDHPR